MGVFITFEGTDGCGKTSVINKVSERLRNDGYDLVCSREPGGNKICEEIRNVILDVDNKGMTSVTEALLYAASRSQHLQDVIIPNLEKGKLVICDRFVDSSYVYQGIVRGIGLDSVISINDFVVKEYMPDLTIFIDVSPEVCLMRKNSRAQKADRLDLESENFHKKVYEGYKYICELFKDRIVTINGEQELGKVCDDTYNVIKTFLDKHNERIL